MWSGGLFRSVVECITSGTGFYVNYVKPKTAFVEVLQAVVT